MAILTQLILNGLIAGGIYALISLGYTMVYGILKFINFAHGEIFMFGAYFGYIFIVLFGMNVFLAFLLSMVLAALMGIIIEKIAYKPLRKAHRLAPLITAIGVSILLQSLAFIFFTAKIRTLRVGEVSKVYNFQGASITQIQIIIIITSVVLMFLLYLFIQKTKLGKAMRALADNTETASIVGINVNKVISVVFAIGSALAAAAGILVGLDQNIHPTMGISFGIKAFTAAVVGGIGNIYGAFVGGFLIGLVENLGIWFIPSGYKDAIAFVILLLVLLFRPSGIFGASEARA